MSSSPDQVPPEQRAGRAMLIFAWVAALMLLAVLFQGVLDTSSNSSLTPVVQRDGLGQSEVVLQRNPQGHYLAKGQINGHAVTFLVDTGATDIAIPEALAERMRLRRSGSGISQTANGPVAVWYASLERVRLGDIELAGVRAAIVPTMAARDPVLLGMSFLRQTDFEQRDGRLTLRYAGPA